MPASSSRSSIPCSATSKPGSCGTHHGVSAKHLPRYLREWSYRFNRRNLPDGLDGYLIRRAVECATITYDQLKKGTLPGGANRVRRLPAAVAQGWYIQGTTKISTRLA